MSLWRGGENAVPRRGRPARARALGAGLPLRRRAEEARARLQRADRADGQLVQAAEARRRRRAGRPGRRSGSRTATTTAPRCSASRARAHRGPHDRRLLQPVPRGGRHARRRASTESSSGSTLASRTRRTSTTSVDDLARARARDAARRTCSTRSAELEQDDVLRAALGRGRGRGLRRLLRAGEARRVVPLPRAGHARGSCAST